MVSLIAKAAMRIGGKVVKAGDGFEIDERYARTLIATRKAARASDKPVKGKAETKAEAKADAKVEVKAESKENKKYKTRHLKADDE
jgi:hypothetical protein